MEGLPRRSEAQRQPPWELWRKFSHGVDETPCGWSQHKFLWVIKEKKKIFPSELHTIKDFLVSQNHHQTPKWVIFPHWTTPYQGLPCRSKLPRMLPVGHQHTPQRVILPSGSFTKQILLSWNTKATYANILWELNMQA